MATGDTEKRVVRVTIFQQPYTLRAAGDAAETEALADGLDELMHQIAERTASTDAARVAVMAALHLADKLRSAEKRAQAGAGESDQRVQAVRDQFRDSSLEVEQRSAELKRRNAELEERAKTAERRVAELEQKTNQADAAQSSAMLDFSASLRERLSALDERLAGLLEEEAR